jgi:hypothetical protein
VTRPGARLALAWVRLYTRGAEPGTRARRAAEIASDVWEQEHAAGPVGRAWAPADAEILLRCLRGMPADLSWRLRHRSATDATSMAGVMRTALVIDAALLAAWFVVLGVGINFGEDSSSIWWTLCSFASAVAVLAGVRLMRRSQWAGAALLAPAALPLAVITSWALFPPVLAVAAVALAVLGGGAASPPRRSTSA